ncbi:upstream stimulatory factor 2 [Acyrthosiphon pisum]|uniref:BHLH domain-containing protein n=1 Tax=Acyrthosiphon pisum TaxID=7029 RepID=A0A8R2A5L7_ACYPI|nr:upstream stimulatory factor 2 [Acyrthosiphon pisum]|eukprot:XP_001947444.2 PREDICTED: upstream stimulatory factor 2 [Acyrthosiphon pisum]
MSMKMSDNDSLNVGNTYKVANNGQLIKLDSNILGAQTLIVTDDDGSLESVDEQPTAAVIENGNVTGIVMSKTNDTNITQYELRPNNNATQFFVVQPINDLFTTTTTVKRPIVPLNSEVPRKRVDRTVVTRDAKRRLTHNEVERRRRDKINQWIMYMSKIIPDCAEENKTNYDNQSKGGILAKACDYINELKSTNQRLMDCVKQMEAVNRHNDELRMENEELRGIVSQHGLLSESFVSRDGDSS